MAVASKWDSPGTDTVWWTIPQPAKMAVTPQLQSVCAVVEIFGKQENLTKFKKVSLKK
jgi:hypothetical protein